MLPGKEDKQVDLFCVIYLFFLFLEMASLATAEPALCPGALPAAESVVPACMFAPDRGCVDDPCGEEGSEDGEGTNGESADHLDLSSKVGLTVNCTQKRLISETFQPSSGSF